MAADTSFLQASRDDRTPILIIDTLKPHQLQEAAEASFRWRAYGAQARHFSVAELMAWLAISDHYALRVSQWTSDRAHELDFMGLMVCHADEEDFIADAFVLARAYLGSGIEYEMVRTLARMALACGCGAVVLPLARNDTNRSLQVFYGALGQGLQPSANGGEEVAIASAAVEDVLALAQRQTAARIPHSDPVNRRAASAAPSLQSTEAAGGTEPMERRFDGDQNEPRP